MSIVKFQKSKRKKLSLTTALALILSSSLLISGSAYFAYFYYQHLQEVKKADWRYNIEAIVQSTKSKELLQAEYLAEQLGLSIDQPTNLYTFNRGRGEQQLLRSPLIHSATIHKVSPGTLFIDYSLRKPMAYLGDLSNTAIDHEGVLIPFKPFFTPKSLPVIYLGQAFFTNWKQGSFWGNSIQGKLFVFAKEIIHYFENEKCGNLESIDLKYVNTKSLGKREIVLGVQCQKKVYVRLPVENPVQSLKDYKTLYSSTTLFQHSPPDVIDLRLDSQALLQ